jgi:replication-associated recombination protein RarA
MRLDEKYRPTAFADVVGQDKAIDRAKRALAAGEQAFWVSGQSGTGKTTIARIIAGMLAAKETLTETVGRQLTVSRLQELKIQWGYRSWFSDGYALIVNESHGLTKPVIEVMLDMLENLPPKVVVIFTTTNEGNDLFDEQLDSGPFASRCVDIHLTSRGLCELFAERIKEIAQAENLDGKPLKAYTDLLKSCRNNFRLALKKVADGAMLE